MLLHHKLLWPWRRGAFAHDQLRDEHGELVTVGGILYLRNKLVKALLRSRAEVLANRGQWRLEVGRLGRIVEANHGDILRQ